MINPLTFNSDGSNQYLTWARDEASVIDAILSSRTSMDVFTMNDDLTPPHSRNGATHIYIPQFDATINKKGTATINYMRAFVSGRYIEILNYEVPVISLTPSQYSGGFSDGVGFVNLTLFAYRTDNVPRNIFPTYGNYRFDGFTNKGINETPRNIEQRISMQDVVSTRFLVYWDRRATQDTKLFLTTPNKLGNPAEMLGEFNNPQQFDVSNVVVRKHFEPSSSSGFDNLESKVGLPVKYSHFGSKQHGAWSIIGAQHKDFDYSDMYTTNPEENTTKGFDSNKKYRTSYGIGGYAEEMTDDERLSGYFGINATKKAVPDALSFERWRTLITNTGSTSRYYPTITISNAETIDLFNRVNDHISVFRAGFDGDRLSQPGVFENGNTRRLNTRQRSTLAHRNTEAQVVSTVDSAPTNTVTYKEEIVLSKMLSDVSLTVQSINYLTRDDVSKLENGFISIASNSGVTMRSNEKRYALIQCEASANNRVMFTQNGDYLDLQDYTSNVQLWFLVRLDDINVFHEVNGKITHKTIARMDEATFTKELTNAGLTDVSFFSKFLKPHAENVMLRQILAFNSAILVGLVNLAIVGEKQDNSEYLQIYNHKSGVYAIHPPLQ